MAVLNRRIVMRLVRLRKELGFAPIKLGGLSEGGLLVQARGNNWGQLIFKDLVKFDLMNRDRIVR